MEQIPIPNNITNDMQNRIFHFPIWNPSPAGCMNELMAEEILERKNLPINQAGIRSLNLTTRE
jgi:hypothetical protein